MSWTHFYDMHSGGGTKQKPYEHIYIELPEEAAVEEFERRFGHNPNDVACTCCGNNYSISEAEDLQQLTGYQRGCRSAEDFRGWIANADFPPDYRKSRYLEHDEQIPEGMQVSRFSSFNERVSLKDYCSKPDVLIITKDEL